MCKRRLLPGGAVFLRVQSGAGRFIAYGGALLGLFLFSAPYAHEAIKRQIAASVGLLQQAPVRGAVLTVFSVFAIVSFSMFAWSLAKSLFGKPVAKTA